MQVRGQVLIITTFALAFALLSIYMLLAPIRDKILRIKAMEDVYQAISNGEKGIEASLLRVFKNYSLDLIENESQPDPNCGGLGQGECHLVIFQPDTTTRKWRNGESFLNNTFTLIVEENGEIKNLIKSISDGYKGKEIRTVIFLSGFR
jgi:hypothetical protein